MVASDFYACHFYVELCKNQKIFKEIIFFILILPVNLCVGGEDIGLFSTPTLFRLML